MTQNNANIPSDKFSPEDIRFMNRALELARLGKGNVSPNPMVGCVIVHEGEIIGEGWHREYGKAHAEVNAINSVENPSILQESTCYVTLEPCAHFGKTPPCADLLANKRVKRVVVGATDSNPLVGGKGIAKLKEAGIQVNTGCLEEESINLNKSFFTTIEKKRPYVILKWAQTTDGYVARSSYDSKWISNEYSRSMVHQWRAEEDAILVGTNTAHYDDPTLNVRTWSGKDPLRLVIDKKLRLNNDLKLFDGSIPTVVYNTKKNSSEHNLEYKTLDSTDFIQNLLSDLCNRKIQSLIVEGGAATLKAFIDLDLWDEARVFTSGVLFKEGIEAPDFRGQLVSKIDLMSDKLEIYLNQ